MLAEFDVRYLPDSREIPESRRRSTASWRGVAAAWALVILIGLVFGGLSEVAALFGPGGQSVNPLTGAVIPRHDPVCAAPMVSSDRVPDYCRLPTSSVDQRDFLLTPGT
ncbi:MAG TPA: hypothetical protein VE993_21305 [Stellaceae bacterium]|nr:hypothetical protein [Stellaceae bacterium]